jgi:hypothetical protein
MTTSAGRARRTLLIASLLLAAPPLGGGLLARIVQESSEGSPRVQPRVSTSKVLPDGTLEIHFDDGTIRRVPGPAKAAPAGGEVEPETKAGERETRRDARRETLIPDAPAFGMDDSATKTRYLEALREYYAYRLNGYQHRRRVFEWQLSSSKVIFATVLVLVATGVIFAGLQFYVGFKRQLSAAERAMPDAVTQLDVSATGLKVSSPVLGVIILVISLAFFYLYLVYVYPIGEVL